MVTKGTPTTTKSLHPVAQDQGSNSTSSKAIRRPPAKRGGKQPVKKRGGKKILHPLAQRKLKTSTGLLKPHRCDVCRLIWM